MGCYSKFNGLCMFDGINQCDESSQCYPLPLYLNANIKASPPKTRNHQKALKRKTPQLQSLPRPLNSTQAHFLQLNMHKSEIVEERLWQYIIRFNTARNLHDIPLDCLLQEPPSSGPRLSAPPLTTLKLAPCLKKWKIANAELAYGFITLYVQ